MSLRWELTRLTCSWLICVSCLVGSCPCQILWEQGWLPRVREGRGKNREEREWERREHKLEVVLCFNFYLTLTFPATTALLVSVSGATTFFLSMCSLCHTSCTHFSLLVLFSSSCMYRHCTHTLNHAFTFTHAHTQTHTHAYACTHTCVRACTRACAHTHTHTHTHNVLFLCCWWSFCVVGGVSDVQCHH